MRRPAYPPGGWSLDNGKNLSKVQFWEGNYGEGASRDAVVIGLESVGCAWGRCGLACRGEWRGFGSEVQHGIGFLKGCTSPTAVGQPYTCAFSVQNVLDEANDTLTINSLTDTVHAAGGDVGGATNILPLVRVTTLTAPPNPVQSGATCAAASGDGSLAAPYTGVTMCTLPPGSRLQVLPFSHYTVQAADFALPGHVLRDDGSLGWHDLCNGGAPNCNPNPPANGAASQSLVADANIQITPASANNPVGANHVLTITVNALGGTIGAGPHIATASIVSGPGSFVGSPTCTYTGGAATASCTVTITSATVGTTVVRRRRISR